jgi:FtsZ-binding cell division protein ZapB
VENNEELVRLEQLVDTLINKYNMLKGEFHALQEKLRDSEDECEILKLDVAQLHEQRSEVGKRVAGLLGRIEQWESEQKSEKDAHGGEGENEEFFVAPSE